MLLSKHKLAMMLLSIILVLELSMVIASTIDVVVDTPPPTILDTDYGSFIDDIFAVGLLLQSTDVLDPKIILTTSEHPDWSANCVSEQIVRSDLSGFGDRPKAATPNDSVVIAVGETLPPYAERGTVCGIPGLIGFALKDTCKEARDPNASIVPNGVEYAAQRILESDRKDWVYIVVGGQTSLQRLIRDFPEALSKIETLVIMGGNWCTGFDAYPDVPTPTAETNIGCDMNAANFVLEAASKGSSFFPKIYYVPIATVNVLSGEDYSLILDAATPKRVDQHDNPIYNKAAEATIDFYNAWSVAARADPGLLVHKEAMTFDPAYESTPQFDAVAVLVAMDIVRGNPSARVAQHEFTNGVHFVTNPQAEQAFQTEDWWKGSKPPKAAYSLWSGSEASLEDKLASATPISDRCKGMTPHHFDRKAFGKDSSYDPVTIQAALGFVSREAENEFFHEMALRISGQWSLMSKSQNSTTQDKNNTTDNEDTLESPLSSPPIPEASVAAISQLAMAVDEFSASTQ